MSKWKKKSKRIKAIEISGVGSLPNSNVSSEKSSSEDEADDKKYDSEDEISKVDIYSNVRSMEEMFKNIKKDSGNSNEKEDEDDSGGSDSEPNEDDLHE